MITSDAMIVSCTMMRMLVGCSCGSGRDRDVDRASTAITASDMTTAVSSLVVTASAEQIPSTCGDGVVVEQRVENASRLCS
jgi:hypothetical protein